MFRSLVVDKKTFINISRPLSEPFNSTVIPRLSISRVDSDTLEKTRMNIHDVLFSIG